MGMGVVEGGSCGYGRCKDSICNDPKMVLGSYVKDPNNIICKAWA